MTNGVTTQFVFANFFESELVAGLTASSTTMLISPSDAEDLPIIVAGSSTQAQITIWDGQLPPEIVAVTANDQSGTMTIMRAQEGTVAQAWASGTQVRSSITALVLNTALAAYFDIGTVLSAHFLSLSGGTLTGPLNLAANPTVPLQAATKSYVDNIQGTGLPSTGGSMTGPINMNSNLINNLHDPGSAQDAATKNYVDTAVAPLAPRASPAFTGVPTAPTPASTDNSTTLATTAFVAGAVGGVGGAWTAGDMKITLKSVADAGWLMMDDSSIGWYNSNATHRDATSGTTAFLALFTVLWGIAAIPMYNAAGQIPQPRGSSASADHNAGYVMALPKVLGRALAISGQGAGLTARALGSTYGYETHTLVGSESVPHRHVAVVQVPEADVTDAQVLFLTGGATNGLTEGNFTGTNLTRAITWQPNSFGNTGPRVYDGGSAADRTGNALTLNDSVYFGNTGQPVPGAAVAVPHENMPPESFINVMVKQ